MGRVVITTTPMETHMEEVLVTIPGEEEEEEDEEKENHIKNIFPKKTRAVLGSLQLISSGCVMAFGIFVLNGDFTDIPICSGITASFFFFISGMLSISIAYKWTKVKEISTLVMSVVSAISACVLISVSNFAAVVDHCYHEYLGVGVKCMTGYSFLTIFGFVMLVISTVVISLIFKVTIESPFIENGRSKFKAGLIRKRESIIRNSRRGAKQ